MVKMVNPAGVTTEVAPEAVPAMLAAGFSVVPTGTTNSEGPIPKKGLNKQQRIKVASTNSSQSLVIPANIAQAVKAGTLSSLEAKITDFLLKKSGRTGANYVACQLECNFENSLVKFCILDNVQNERMEIGNLVTLIFQTTENEAIRSGVEVVEVR